MLQSCIPFLPKGTQIINEHVALYRHDGQLNSTLHLVRYFHAEKRIVSGFDWRRGF
jgi:hypothetical protein